MGPGLGQHSNTFLMIRVIQLNHFDTNKYKIPNYTNSNKRWYVVPLHSSHLSSFIYNLLEGRHAVLSTVTSPVPHPVADIEQIFNEYM